MGLEPFAGSLHHQLMQPSDTARHLRTTLGAPAPRHVLERLHRRLLAHHLVLGALRRIPQSDELLVHAPTEAATSA